MNVSERNAIDELIDHCGSLYHAVENREKLIARRRAEGKASPIAEGQLAFLLSLPVTYNTPKQERALKNWLASGGANVG